MKKYIFLFLLLGLHLFFLGNLQFTIWPEMLSYPLLVKNGFNLYTDLIHPYPPLLTFALTFIAPSSLNLSDIPLKIFTWTLILVSDVILFKFVLRETKKYILSYLALAFFVFTQPFLEGNMLWFDLAIVTPMIAGIYFLTNKLTARNIYLAGLFLGLAVFIKQTAALGVIVGILYIVSKSRSIKSVIQFLLPSLVMGIIFLVWLLVSGQLIAFLNWNLYYPFTFWSKFPGYVQMYLSSGQALKLLVLVLPLLVLSIYKFKEVNTNASSLVRAMLLMAFIMVYPRFSFFHFQFALILIACLYGLLLQKIKNHQKLIFLWLMYIGVIVITIVYPEFRTNWQKESRFWSARDRVFGQQVAQENIDGSVYFLGLPSTLYVSSGKLPPKPWTDNFGWYLEIPLMQEAILERWVSDPPKLIYWRKPDSGAWFDLGVYQPKKITEWIQKNYTMVEDKEGITKWQLK